MNETVAYRLVPFDEGGPDLGRELTQLHSALLAHSPVALLGSDFLQHFYYRVLPRMGLIFGHVAFVNGQPAGFIVATHDSAGFMQTAIRRRFLHIAWVMILSMLRDPRRLGAMWEGIQIMRGLPPDAAVVPHGELLSMGVLPAFRSREFLAKFRLRISQDLLTAAMAQLAARHVGRARVIVDADNLEARLFYSGQGWMPGLSRVPGWRKETVEFIWQRQDWVAPADSPSYLGTENACSG